ncbi:MAG: nucleotidyl transferase AbiEii/AbiGii toxin family protein [Flavobacteriales bacterium]
MKLHLNPKLFSDTLRATSEYMGINLQFVEKDYWITLVLHRMADSKYAEGTVFKGGTSLSKAYRMIDRFSTDVDLAIVPNEGETGSQVRARLRGVELGISTELTERPTEGISSKGSKFRRSVFEYNPIDKGHTNNTLILEVNSFANPFPFEKCSIQSMVYEFMANRDSMDLIDSNELNPFEINVLCIDQTLLEKLISLFRASFDEDVIVGLSSKVRHFYDIYYLMQQPLCKELVEKPEFSRRLFELFDHDREIFDEPIGWKEKAIRESPLIVRFEEVWEALRDQYTRELGALAYRPIPEEKSIAEVFVDLTKSLRLNTD